MNATILALAWKNIFYFRNGNGNIIRNTIFLYEFKYSNVLFLYMWEISNIFPTVYYSEHTET